MKYIGSRWQMVYVSLLMINDVFITSLLANFMIVRDTFMATFREKIDETWVLPIKSTKCRQNDFIITSRYVTVSIKLYGPTVVYTGNYEYIVLCNFGCREAVSSFKVIEWGEGGAFNAPPAVPEAKRARSE